MRALPVEPVEEHFEQARELYRRCLAAFLPLGKKSPDFRERFVLMMFAYSTNEDAETAAPLESISLWTAIPVPWVKRCVNRLVSAGWLVPIDGGYRVSDAGGAMRRQVGRGGRP